jgi:phage terminase large subunit
VTDLLQLEYVPRAQFVPFHERDNRWACLVAHRRAGKTVACVNDLVTRALYTNKKDARYAYIAPFYRQAKEVAWKYLKDATKGVSVKISESTLSVELINGSKIQLFGADNPDALRGLYFDGVIIDEFGDTRPSLWGSVVRPTLADRRGWAVFIGTPKGENHFYDIAKEARINPDWLFIELKASESGILPPDELAELKSQMSEEEYEREMECNFKAAVLGTYYAPLITLLEKKQQIGTVPYDPNFPVEVAADLGFTDSSAYWFWQYRPDGIAVIDYEEAHSQALDYYFDLLKYKTYTYSTIWLPHDAKAKSLQTGRSTVEQFLQKGFPVRITPSLSLQHGIDAARLVLPMCYFDSAKCESGIESLRAYRRQYDEVRKVFSDAPLHDWSSHGADAFRYLALVSKTKLQVADKTKAEKRKVDGNWFYTAERDELGRLVTNATLNDLWDTAPTISRRI